MITCGILGELVAAGGGANGGIAAARAHNASTARATTTAISGDHDLNPPPRLVSIAIINHNYARFLAQAIDSALAQNYQPIEVIVVDDGSTDESRSIIARYGEHVMALLQDNLGHVEAVNLAISASRGEALLLLDADDMLYPHCLATAMAVWDGTLSKLQFRLDTVDAAGVDQLMPFPALTSDLTSGEILRRAVATGYYPWPVSSGNLYARAYLARVAPIPASRIFKSPDGYLNKLAPLFGGVRSLPVCLGAYRVHGDNAWAQTPTAINAGRYARMVRFDATLHAEFVAIATSMGFAVPDYDRAAVPQMLEARLLSLRLWPGAHPIMGDRRSRLLWLALRCACRAQGVRPLGRVLWAIWLVALAAMPAPLIRWIARHWRAQSGRGLLAQLIVGLSRLRLSDRFGT